MTFNDGLYNFHLNLDFQPIFTVLFRGYRILTPTLKSNCDLSLIFRVCVFTLGFLKRSRALPLIWTVNLTVLSQALKELYTLGYYHYIFAPTFEHHLSFYPCFIYELETVLN